MCRSAVTTVLFAALVAVMLMSTLASAAKSPTDWQGRRIYQVLTDRFARSPSSSQPCNVNEYCGGSFNGLKEHLDYIQGMGFNAIWISPVPVNFKGGYHGYWATDFFKINPHFGSASDLKEFVDAAHTKGIWIMIDVVVNHVGPVGNDFSQVYPFNHSSHYHRDCAVNQYTCFTNEVYNCRLANLPDLNQSVPFVTAQLSKYVNWLLSEFEFDGIRADTVMYIEQSYWRGLMSSVGEPYLVGEVFSNFNCNLKYTQYGIDATLNYPLYYTLRSVFQSTRSMRGLGSTWRQMKQYQHPDWEVNFIDNHDNTRWLNTTHNIAAYKSAFAHMFFTNGIPCVLYGTEQYFAGGIEDNYCRQPLWPTNFKHTEFYDFFATLNKAHEELQPYKYTVQERWEDDSMYCFVRGPKLMMCTTNTMRSETRTIPNLPFAGMTVCDYFNPTKCASGASTMQITVPSGGLPVLFVGSN